MATVRFTTTCDVLGCGKRAEEYSAWPTCRDCGEDICTEHQVPGSDTEDERGLCVCLECNAFDDAPSPSEPMDPAEVLARAAAFDRTDPHVSVAGHQLCIMGLALRMIVQRCKHRWTFRDGETVTMIQRTAEQALRECGK